MEEPATKRAEFPSALIEWAGHHAGGVRRLFDEHSGRPNKEVLRTNLLSRLESWASDLSSGDTPTPRILLLVGGPGNGKTEAVESTIRWLDGSLGCQGGLISALTTSFSPSAGLAVPRLVRIDAGELAASRAPRQLMVVQDASVVAGQVGISPAQLLINELAEALDGPPSLTYLCCVNRGILDDALIFALDSNLHSASRLLETITRSVSLDPEAPSCWPLEGYESVAIWPMDAESLLVNTDDGYEPPATTLLSQALSEDRWPVHGTCASGARCPFCGSRAELAKSGQDALLTILRWYEVSSGRRWSFRDLFSLISYLLAGHRASDQEDQVDPCQWAAGLIRADEGITEWKKPSKVLSSAIFVLATSSFEHLLFHRWDVDGRSSFRQDLKDLGLEQDHTLMGLYFFLQGRKSTYLPATISSLLEGIASTLDPAISDPDGMVPVSARTTLALRDIDANFSRSVEEGLELVRKYQFLTPLETELLKRLAKADRSLSASAARRKKPAAANRVQRTIRDFACRLVRRTLGAKSAVVPDTAVLKAYREIIEDVSGGGHLLYDAALQVEELLNDGEHFEVSLTTTFGQPLPPVQRQATLVVPRRAVKIREDQSIGRPRSPICFLRVGSGLSEQPIALTYDLFKAVKELERGMSVASLPRSVVALLDTTKARLSGPIVRDAEILERAKIRLGSSGVAISRYRGGFISRQERVRS
jgi:hypothetical protein